MSILAKKPSVRRNFDTDLEAAGRERHRPVTGAGKMTADGYIPENNACFEDLIEVMNGRRQGRHPMAVPCEVLTAAGHGPRETRRIVAAMGDISLVDGIKRHKDLRRQCLGCAESMAEVRRCIVIDCPIWPYRMGRNPHNPRRGTNPFSAA